MTTVRDLIDGDQCSPACIAAPTDAARCRCPHCGGRLHGLLAPANVDHLLDDRRHGGLHRLTDLEVLTR